MKTMSETSFEKALKRLVQNCNEKKNEDKKISLDFNSRKSQPI